jgi:predicted N-acetyltransferase YhbS
MSHPFAVRPVATADLARISDLHERTFGPGRFVRTAYRVREGLPPISDCCLVATVGSELAAAIRFAPVTIGGKPGALMLGPLAVEPLLAGQGYGRHLVAGGIARAKEKGYRLMILVGDLPYYGRFGFKPVPPGRIAMPGPVNSDRLLALELEDGALADYAGLVAGAT